MKKHKEINKQMSIYDFVFGGLSGMIATFVIQPLDTVKVRIQLIGEKAQKGNSKSSFVVAKGILGRRYSQSHVRQHDASAQSMRSCERIVIRYSEHHLASAFG